MSGCWNFHDKQGSPDDKGTRSGPYRTGIQKHAWSKKLAATFVPILDLQIFSQVISQGNMLDISALRGPMLLHGSFGSTGDRSQSLGSAWDRSLWNRSPLGRLPPPTLHRGRGLKSATLVIDSHHRGRGRKAATEEHLGEIQLVR